jgi:regulator of protease activity HflC (stomatin/prohibitin superfamily)
MFSILIAVVVALIATVTLFLVNDRQRTNDGYVTVYPLRRFAIIPALVVAIVVAFESFTIVPAGHVGVQVTMGTVNPQALQAGVNFVNPISNVRDVEIRVKRADLKEAQAGTKDLQSVHTDIVIQYRMSPEKVPTIYSQFGLNVDDKILGPGVNEAFKAVTAHYNSEELITKRDQVSSEILAHVRQKVAPFDIEVQGISLVNFGFSKSYQEAIEAKVIATQQKQKAEQDLERIKVEAQSRIAQAEGEAKAIAIQASAIQNQGGAAYVNLKAIEKWDGKLPQYMLGSNTTPFVNVGK